MKYHKIILILLGSLLFIWLWFLTISCVSREELIRRSMLHTAVAAYKYDWIVFENNRLMDNDKFKAYVEKQVKDTGYIEISYDTAERLHRTYLIRAWVFYKKKSTVKQWKKQ